MLKSLAGLSVFALAQCVAAHGGHEKSGPAPGESMQQYAQRHMASEHHIDSFDAASFFKLHDLNQDGRWDRAEIEAVYGVHHVYSQKKSKDEEEHQKKADQVVDSVLKILDLNHDGLVEVYELEKVGLAALPSFENLGAEGHHYDVESEFFLHHEELFHATPETQADEAYTHPEDIEHFAQHERIERAEAEREAKYAGLSVEEVLSMLSAEPPKSTQPPGKTGSGSVPQQNANDPQQHVRANPDNVQPGVPPPQQGIPTPEGHAPSSEEWGSGEKGYKTPKDASDRMRKNLPYKSRMQYKFRRNWGDF